MAPPTQRPRRPELDLFGRLASGWQRLGVLEWASRLLVAWVLTVGMLAGAGASLSLGPSEADISIEGGEDSETVEQVSVHANTSRRPNGGVGPRARAVRLPRPPELLSPTRRPAPRQRSARPRRTGPPDDDDDESLARAVHRPA